MLIIARHLQDARWEMDIQTCDPSFFLPDRGVPINVATARTRLTAATRLLRKTQKQSEDIRIQSYQQLLATYDSDQNSSTAPESKRKAKIVLRTLLGEASRRVFRNVRNVVKPSDFSSLTKLQIPRQATAGTPGVTLPGAVHGVLKDTTPDNLIWDTVITREEIESHLLAFNRESFRAAAESPCGHGVIHDALTFSSLSEESKELFRGVVPSTWVGDDKLLQEFLASFQIPQTVLDAEPINIELSSEDISYGFKTWAESTATSPSGRHLGHYKALIQDPCLLQSLTSFMNIAIGRGIALPRWSQAVNVLIEKDTGFPKVNRLRIIHLFEADYNLFLKTVRGSRLVRHATSMNLLNDGQHGSVPGRTTLDPIMLNQLTTDMCRILKTNYARFDNDASACFDRIIVALGMLAARRCGMPESSIRSHAKALEFMKYTDRTVYGISEANYHGTPFAPMFGTGQGSGASPAVWLLLVVILLNTIDRVIPERMGFQYPDGKLSHTRLVDAFVDDTALGFTDDGNKSIEELVVTLENMAQTWERLLHFSGGTLNLSKCSWFTMYWDWKNGRPELRNADEDDPRVAIRQGTNAVPTPIKRQQLDQASRILGVFLTPLGDFSEHIRVMKRKADTMAGRIKSPRL